MKGEWTDSIYIKKEGLAAHEDVVSDEAANKPVVNGKEPTVIEALLVTALVVGGFGGFLYLITKLAPTHGHSPEPARWN